MRAPEVIRVLSERYELRTIETTYGLRSAQFQASQLPWHIDGATGAVFEVYWLIAALSRKDAHAAVGVLTG